MLMQLYLLAIVTLAISALSSLFARVWGVAGAVIAGCLGIWASVATILQSSSATLTCAWPVPNGGFVLALDPFAAVFLLLLSILICIIPVMVVSPYRATFCLLNVLLASLFVIVLAADAFLFMYAWEIMSLSSYFLVSLDHSNLRVRHAAWQYLIATHISGLFLLVLFILLGNQASDLTFAAFALHPLQHPGILTCVFLCALVGFGTKAGLVPFHAWLPDAYTVAPAFVPAILSGIVSKVAIYGLLRVLSLVHASWLWTGFMLVVVGLVSAFYGIVMALAQNRIRRVVAYSSIENIGIITLACGLGTLGLFYESPQLAIIGFAGALFHIFNHGIFKSFLFLLVGALEQAAHIDSLDEGGGLYKQLPKLGTLFLLGCVAITALPPLNGFFSEYLIYLTGYNGALQLHFPFDLPFLMTIPILALVGGIALVTFSKLFGILFLGSHRQISTHPIEDIQNWQLVPFVLLAGLCVMLGSCSGFLLHLLAPAIAAITPWNAATTLPPLLHVQADLQSISLGCVGLVTICAMLAYVRHALLRNRTVTTHVTWGCGYTPVGPRLQYTGSSFSYPLLRVFRGLFERQRNYIEPKGLFLHAASYAMRVPDVFLQRLYQPLFSLCHRGLRLFRFIQHGHVRLYVLYIIVTLIVLLTWKLG